MAPLGGKIQRNNRIALFSLKLLIMFRMEPETAEMLLFLQYLGNFFNGSFFLLSQRSIPIGCSVIITNSNFSHLH